MKKDFLCAICGGNLHSKKISLDRLIENHLYLFEDVPVQICDQCDEIWIPGREAERMDQILQKKLKPKKEILVPVY